MKHTTAQDVHPSEAVTPPSPSPRLQLIAQSQPQVYDSLSLSGRCLMLSDALALVLAFLCGGYAAQWINPAAGNFNNMVREFIIFMGLGGIALLWLDAQSHYRQRLPYWEHVGHILTVCLVGSIACGFVQFAFHSLHSRLWLGLNWLFLCFFMFAGRGLVHALLERMGKWRIPSVLIGTGTTAESAMHALSREKRMGYDIVEQLSPATLDQFSAPGAWKQLLAACEAGHLFLALEGSEIEQHKSALKALVRERVPCSVIPPWLGLPAGTLSPHYFLMHDVVLLHDTNRLNLLLPRFIKRSFDLVVASSVLLMLFPVFIIAALWVRMDGHPAIFSQLRVGKDGRKFSCYKFRSMRVDAEEYLQQYLVANPEAAEEWRKFQKLKHDVRITKAGKFIRKTSIDELPQLINVIKGDMSLVGPRPIMPGQEEFYGDDFVFYESVRPGITGPWQVSGRNRLTFSERVLLESCYARNWSLWMDIVILLKTIPALLKQEQAF